MQKLRYKAVCTGASIVGGAFTLGLIACAGQSKDESFGRVHGDLTAEATNAAALDSGASCDALLARFQNDLLTQVSQRAAQARVSNAPYYGGGVFIDDVAPAVGVSAPVSSASAAPLGKPLAASRSSAAAGAGASAASDAPPLAGVQEGDFVKLDGDRIYLTHGTDLFVLDATSAAATEIVATVPLEGQATDLVIADGRIVVFSAPPASPEGGDEVETPFYPYYSAYTKLTLLDATSGSFEVLRESYIEGSYASSRRDGEAVRAIIQQYSKAQLDYPNVSYTDIFGHARSQSEIDVQVDLWVLLATESIEDSVIEDYLPRAFERVGGDLVKLPLDCADYLAPTAASPQPDVGFTSLLTLDLAAPAAPLGKLSVTGNSDPVFIGPDSVILRLSDYSAYTDELPQVTSRLHRFAFDGVNATYTGSGQVAGYIPAQFVVDERAGVIRVATSEDRYVIDADGGGGYAYAGTSSRVVTLAAATFAELGRSSDFGGTQYVTAGRFLGDRGYIELNSGADSELTVLDLSDAAAPTVTGQVHNTGYTGVLYPLASGTLLGVGQEIDVTGNIQSVALQLFDVSDPTAPSVKQRYAFTNSGYSEALYDARALSVAPGGDSLALQLYDYATGQGSLEVFHVSSAGLNHLASITPPLPDLSLLECLQLLGYPTDPDFIDQIEQDPASIEAITQSCRSYDGSNPRRGLFHGSDLFAIGSRSVSAYSLDALDGPPLSTVTLPLLNPYYPLYQLSSAPRAPSD